MCMKTLGFSFISVANIFYYYMWENRVKRFLLTFNAKIGNNILHICADVVE